MEKPRFTAAREGSPAKNSAGGVVSLALGGVSSSGNSSREPAPGGQASAPGSCAPSRKKPKRTFRGRMIITAAPLALQVALLLALQAGVAALIYLLPGWAGFTLDAVCRGCALAVALLVVNREMMPVYKLAWCAVILVFPVAGGVGYLLSRDRRGHRAFHRKEEEARRAVNEAFAAFTKETDFPAPLPIDEAAPRLTRALSRAGFPGYGGTRSVYFSRGREMYDAMMRDMRAAKKFIFLQFFIIREGEMWQEILSLLREKARAGVEVRVLYDGMGSLTSLPWGAGKTLAEAGIAARVFHPFTPVLTTVQNNRDHKKIVVIDGEAAYTGGINVSDEYVDLYDRCGDWKDGGVLLRGPGVAGLTRIFLESWLVSGDDPAPAPRLLARYFHGEDGKGEPGMSGDEATVFPYACSPFAGDDLGARVYLDLISGARERLYLFTPYFIPGEEILGALCEAARGGIDLRLITPHVGDKGYAHILTRSYYAPLLRAGARVYEYLPGFVHSKVFVADGRVATVGTMNLDYRSLYLHFECGTVLCSREAAGEIERDFLATLEKCHEMSLEEAENRPLGERAFTALARLFEPLL